MRSKYKVYIIDEVHMLTKEAFNALLKTLEEPPPMVKFVFCTTEANKVPDTILSRCQRFDFGTISTDNITIRLRQLAEAEGFQVDEAALDLVARRAAGSMRDSQSLFDQLLAFGSDHITSADVHRLLGTAPDDRLTGLVDALIERRQDEVLTRLEQSLREGVQLEAFTDQLVAYFRDLLVAACGATEVPLMALGNDSREIVNRQAKQWGLQTIAAAMQILAEAKARMQRVSYGRALAELALVRISFLADLDRLDDLIAQLKGGQSIASTQKNTRTVAERHPAPPERLNPPTGQKPTNPPPAEKKNDMNPVNVVSPLPGSAKDAIPEVTRAPAVIELKSGCEKELQSLIADRMNDIVGTSVRRIPSIAIIGPNLLEFCVPINYDLDRKALDRPETVNRLEAIVAELVGHPVRIQFRTGDAVQAASKPAAAVAAVSRGQIVDEPEDPYIQQITDVFGVKSWNVKELVAEAADEERTESSLE